MKNSEFKLFVFLYFSLALTDVGAQAFHHFSGSEGAPLNNAVKKITQDDVGFMWFATSNDLYRYDSKNFKVYTHDETNPRSLSSRHVNDVFCDSKKRLWVSTSDGLNLYDREHDDFVQFVHDPENGHSIGNNRVLKTWEDSRGRLWVGTANGLNVANPDGEILVFSRYLQVTTGPALQVWDILEAGQDVYWLGTSEGLMRFSVKGDRVRTQRFYIDETRKYPKSNNITMIHTDNQGNLWLANKGGGLFRFDTTKERFFNIPFTAKNDGNIPVVMGIVSDAKNGLWIATNSGLAHLSLSDHRMEWHANQSAESSVLTDDAIYALHLDRQGGLWAGGYYKGIDYLHTGHVPFLNLPHLQDGAVPRQLVAGQIGRGPDGTMWFGSEDRSRIIFHDSAAGRYREHIFPVSTPNLGTICMDREGMIWLGGNSVLTRYDAKTRQEKEYRFLKLAPDGSRERTITYLMEDSQGRLWAGTTEGAVLFDRAGESWVDDFPRRDEDVFEGSVTYIYEDSRKNMWFGGANGIFRLNYGERKIQPVPSDKHPAYLRLISIHEDPSGKLWFGSVENMLQEYDATRDMVVSHIADNERDTFVGRIANIQSDQKGYLWISDDLGLVRYHPANRTMQRFDTKDGLPGNPIIRNTAFPDVDGQLYFGTIKGVFHFHPDSIRINDKEAPIVFTGLRLFNKPVPVGGVSGLLPKAPDAVDRIVFQHTQNVFTVEFALLNYLRSDKNWYAYQLEGLEKTWNVVKNPTATYTNLSPGNYTLLVKGANNDGQWNETPARLSIVVLPPWWKTWYAYTGYLLTLLATIYLVTRFFWLRSSFRKENDLYQSKLDFFTNVSHEIRTHLSLIGAPLEKAFQSPSTEVARAYLTHAKNNSDHLMRLVDELLDFRKIQSGNVQLHVSEQDVVGILKNALSAFEHLAIEKGVETRLEAPVSRILLWLDSAQVQKVFYNLLSNAYKFTPEGGMVTVTVAERSSEVAIKVADNGKGITQEHLGHLFTNFFQVYENNTGNTGYGIGLALSKTIVEQHHGWMEVTSELPDTGKAGGSCFTVILRRGNGHFVPSELTMASDVTPSHYTVPALGTPMLSPGQKGKEKYTVLLVEDNEELRSFGREALRGSYRIIEAANGAEGLKIAFDQLPDLIVSDIMMPELNGLDFCDKLKSDVRTSHIPVILLTARSAAYQVVQGLATGADSYLTKPFDLRVLELKIKNLIQVRESLKKHYSRSITLEASNIVSNSPEGRFLTKLKELVEQHVSDPGFGVSEISLEIGMSVSVLYRKLRAVTGMTVKEFVKSVRMKKAAQLLASREYRVNEVAMMVGFESRKHFTREFRKLYGTAPSTFLDTVKQNESSINMI